MKDINYYSALKYPAEIVETDDGFVASHPDLPGCASFGDTAVEALESLRDVRELWLKGQLESKGVAPEPRQPEEFSGRFVIRIPKWLHRLLDKESRRQACSLNTLVVSMLSAIVGLDQTRSASPVETDQAWAGAEEAWSAATECKVGWSFTSHSSTVGEGRDAYIGVFEAMSKKRSGHKGRKFSETFEDSHSTHEKQAN